jgi:hypothetical protein
VKIWHWTLALLLVAGGAAAQPPADEGPDDRFAPLAAPAIDADERETLVAGGVVVRDLPTRDGEGVGVLAMGLIDAPPEELWRVMDDCEGQDEFLPRIRRAVVRDRADGAHTCELVMDMPFPLEDRRQATRNRLRRLPDGGYQRYWSLAPGDWSDLRNHGSWTVHPFADRSLLVSRMEIVPKAPLPLWLIRAAQTRQAPASFQAIDERVRSLRGAGD